MIVVKLLVNYVAPCKFLHFNLSMPNISEQPFEGFVL